MSIAAADLPDDPALLKAMIAALQSQNAKLTVTLRAHDQMIQELRLRIAKLKKQVFGKSSEKIEREIEQLELALEDLLIAAAESTTGPMAEEMAEVDPPTATDDRAGRKPRRRPRVSAATPRERRELDPGSCCPDCGGELRLVGEDVSEMLGMIAAQLRVIEIARLKKSCRCCKKMVQAPAPSRPIPGSMATANLLAYILVSKFDDHLPLYRLNEIFARLGADVPDSTLVEWCGRAMQVLKPLTDRIEAEIMASDLLHADDTPIRIGDELLAVTVIEFLGDGERPVSRPALALATMLLERRKVEELRRCAPLVLDLECNGSLEAGRCPGDRLRPSPILDAPGLGRCMPHPEISRSDRRGRFDLEIVFRLEVQDLKLPHADDGEGHRTAGESLYHRAPSSL